MAILGIISDTHDNLPVIRKAVDLFNRRGVQLVLHAGDFVSPFTSREFSRLVVPMKGVFGNNDGDRPTLIDFFNGIAELKAGFDIIEFHGLKIYLTHLPLPEKPRDCDVYIFGHTHETVVEKNGILTINPGECSGWLSDNSTVALLDTEKMEVKIVRL